MLFLLLWAGSVSFDIPPAFLLFFSIALNTQSFLCIMWILDWFFFLQKQPLEFW
jgi:hypothetical protein